ncbi:Transcription antitermination protein NusB [Geodia barretti]|uniref:Transcription antitermination protein NusB n=1 Tax=Geodia barretti TaxID=519541 RepID=A0AA35TBU3_GEOBA|nr:Transcription antitermination protein NusB [Geodia barretti]
MGGPGGASSVHDVGDVDAAGRRNARVLAVQSLYRYDLSGGSAADAVDTVVDGHRPTRRAEHRVVRVRTRLLVAGSIENLQAVDGCIDRQLEHWDLERLSRVDLAILRMSVYCLLHQRDVPASVVINEAVEIAKRYGTDDSYRFVNGVLDGVRKRVA